MIRTKKWRWLQIGVTIALGLTIGIGIKHWGFQRSIHQPRSVSDLVKALQRQETRWDGIRLTIWNHLPTFAKNFFSELKPIPAQDIRSQACLELKSRGPEAAPTIPILLKGLDDAKQLDPREVVQCLTAIGPSAVTAKNRLLEILRVPAYEADRATMCLIHSSNFPVFVRKLYAKSDPVSAYLFDRLSEASCHALESYRKNLADVDLLRKYLTHDFYKIIEGPLIYEPNRFAAVALRPFTRQLLDGKLEGVKRIRANRQLLEDAFPLEITQYHPSPSSNPLRSEVATALAIIAPQDPEVVSLLIEDLKDPTQYFADRSVAELIRHSSEAGAIFEAAILVANPSQKLQLTDAFTPATGAAKRPIPRLLALLDHPDYWVQYAAVRQLGDLGVNAAEAVSKLVELFQRTSESNSVPTPVVNWPIESYEIISTNWQGFQVRWTPLGRQVSLHERIAIALGAIGPAARAAVPLLEAEYQNPKVPRREESAYARWRIDGNAEGISTVVAVGLDHPDPWKREKTLERMTEIARKDRAAVPYIVKALNDTDLDVRLRAILCLAQAGTNATEVVSALRALDQDHKLAIRIAAARTLKAIESKLPH